MLKMVFMVLFSVVFCIPVFAATEEEETNLDRLVLSLSTKALHEANHATEEKWENSVVGVIAQTAEDFSNFRCPVYRQDSEIVREAFELAFKDGKLSEEWFEAFSQMVAEVSGGVASVELASGSPILDLMPVSYQVLKISREGRSMTFVLMPSTYVGCEEKAFSANSPRFSLLE